MDIKAAIFAKKLVEKSLCNTESVSEVDYDGSIPPLSVSGGNMVFAYVSPITPSPEQLIGSTFTISNKETKEVLEILCVSKDNTNIINEFPSEFGFILSRSDNTGLPLALSCFKKFTIEDMTFYPGLYVPKFDTEDYFVSHIKFADGVSFAITKIKPEVLPNSDSTPIIHYHIPPSMDGNIYGTVAIEISYDLALSIHECASRGIPLTLALRLGDIETVYAPSLFYASSFIDGVFVTYSSHIMYGMDSIISCMVGADPENKLGMATIDFGEEEAV